MSREAPIRMRRIRNRKTPPAIAISEQQPRVHRELRAGHAERQIVDRVLEDPGGQQLDGGRSDDAGEADEKALLVTKNKRQQALENDGHSLASISAPALGPRQATRGRIAFQKVKKGGSTLRLRPLPPPARSRQRVRKSVSANIGILDSALPLDFVSPDFEGLCSSISRVVLLREQAECRTRPSWWTAEFG